MTEAAHRAHGLLWPATLEDGIHALTHPHAENWAWASAIAGSRACSIQAANPRSPSGRTAEETGQESETGPNRSHSAAIIDVTLLEARGYRLHTQLWHMHILPWPPWLRLVQGSLLMLRTGDALAVH